MKPRDISYLKINDIHEYNLPYPQSAFTHNTGMTLVIEKMKINEFMSNHY